MTASRPQLWLLLLAWVAANIHAEKSLGQTGPPIASHIISVHWDKVPLRNALARLADTLGEPIFTDRRVDPDQRISLDIGDADGEAVLNQTATAAALGWSRLGRLVYFGPPAAAGQLRTLAAVSDDAIAQLRVDARTSQKVSQSLDWPRLAEPRQLVKSLVEDHGLRIVGAERIPHDLWPAGSLPDLSLAEQLTVLLIGFDLTCVADSQGRAIRIVPITGPVTIARQYRLPKGANADEFQQQFPDVKIRASGNDLTVAGTVEEHERIGRWLRREREPMHVPPVSAKKTRKLYTLRIEEQPVGKVLRQLGQRLEWSIETDDAAIRAADLSLDARVSFSVQNVDEDALLRTLLRPAGLDYKRDGDHVRVFPLDTRNK